MSVTDAGVMEYLHSQQSAQLLDIQISTYLHDATVGVNKNWTLVCVNFSAKDASNLQYSDYFELSYGNLKKIKDCKNPEDIQVCSKYK